MHIDRKYIEVKFYATYYYANAIRNILHDQLAYIRNLNDFYGDEHILNFFEPFPKYSAFHLFIEFIVESLFFEGLDEINTDQLFQNMGEKYRKLPLNRELECYAIDHRSFDEWFVGDSAPFEYSVDKEDLYEYVQYLRDEGAIGTLHKHIVAEVFFILFSNHSLMQLFNDMMAGEISSTTFDEVPSEFHGAFKRDGVLKRKYIPKWIQKTIFFRDRGQCVLCKSDISGVVCIGNIKNFDHIVPLSNGGLNDVTNIQLLCASCNNKKRDHNSCTSDVYEAWY